MTDPTDHEVLQGKWKANTLELNRLYMLTGPALDMYRARIDALEAEQDALEFEITRANLPIYSLEWSDSP